MSYTKRCNAAERKGFNAKRGRFWQESGQQLGEPALGTVEQRLEIILARLSVGGRYPVRVGSSGEDLDLYRVAS